MLSSAILMTSERVSARWKERLMAMADSDDDVVSEDESLWR